ncbi:PaaI family thioesterase [Tepidiforma sp.]|uniref:PaaI family thioesterase n=1 Tax=Tepidiforma sp. TaxID=2682230 RepID=UPI002ADE29A2|nr:PaaI family thioesterase [Tepidiforma sp.]
MTDNTLASLQQRIQPFFPGLLGIRLTAATPERVTAELTVRDELCTVPGILHGGAIMAFADTLGAVGTVLNLPEGAGTTTIESKTNFFAPGLVGTIITAECIPLHRGRRTQTWQTTIRNPEGRLIAQVTQTQIVLDP